MEIKTCEDYVVTKLMQMENENELLKDELDEVNAKLEDMQIKFKHMSELISPTIKADSDGHHYVKFENSYFYHEYEPRDYEFMKVLFNLNDEREDE